MVKNIYVDDNYKIVEYENGATVKVQNQLDIIEPPVILQITTDEIQMQTLLNTEYLAILSELNSL